MHEPHPAGIGLYFLNGGGCHRIPHARYVDRRLVYDNRADAKQALQLARDASALLNVPLNILLPLMKEEVHADGAMCTAVAVGILEKHGLADPCAAYYRETFG